ncbi:MAG: translocation/assembly module TamB [Paludibacteraceae bacterium]|nr:translocation/assembly module TamB [Paludibacteraceae bacterium]
MLLAFLVFLFGVYTLVNVPAVQNYITRKGCEKLSEQLGCKIGIGRIGIKPFSQVDMNGLIVYDLQGDTLLYAQTVRTKFELIPFFKHRFIFHQIKLEDADIYLKNTEKDGNNFDFIIDSFKGNGGKHHDNIFHFGTIQTRNCHVVYRSDKTRKPIGNLDVSDLDVKNLNLRVIIYYIADKKGRAQIKNLAFEEKSGLQVKSLAANVLFDTTGVRVSDFELALPRSVLQSDSLSLRCDSLADFRDFMHKVDVYANIRKLALVPADIAALVPTMKSVNTTVQAVGTVSGTVSDLKCSGLSLSCGNKTSLRGGFEFSGLPDIKKTYIHASVSKFHTEKGDLENLLSDLTNRPFVLPEKLRNVTRVDFSGQISGYLNDFVTSGTFDTNLGALSADFVLNTDRADDRYVFDGNVKSKGVNLKKLLQNDKLGEVSFNLNVKGTQEMDGGEMECYAVGKVASFEYNGYKYENIDLNGLYENRKFNGKVTLDDPNGNMAIDGLVDFSQAMPFYDFSARVREWNPNKMNLTSKYPELTMSFDIETDVQGNNLDNVRGNVLASDIMIRNGEKVLNIDNFSIESDISDTLSSVIVTSDYVYGVIEGKYSFSTFVSGFKYIASEYMPVLNLTQRQQSSGRVNNFDFDLNVKNMDKVCDLLDLKFTTSSNFNIFGFYDDLTKKFRLRSIIPDLMFNKTHFSSVLVSCENPDDAISFAVDAQIEKLRPVSTNTFGLFFRAWAKHDTVTTNLQWQNNEDKLYAGELSCVTALGRKNTKLTTHTDIQRSNIIFSDTLWTMRPSEVITEDGKVIIKHFLFERDNEHIFLDGLLSKDERDTLRVNVKNVQLGYLKQFLNMNMFSLDGKVSGDGMVCGILGAPDFSADLKVKDFEFNNSKWGDVDFVTQWDKPRESMVTDIKVYTDTSSVAHIAGDIYPKRKIDLDLDIDAEGLKLDFIGVCMQNILQDMRGKAYTQHLKMTGPLTRPSFDGDVYIDNGNFSVDFLKTKYHFSDTLHITPTSFGFDKIRLYDEENNFGTVTGLITHQLFRDFRFDISGDCKNIIGLNTQEGDNDIFYGKMYGTGKVRIYGSASLVNFDIGMRTEEHSKLVIPISDLSSASENTFVTFVNTDTITVRPRRQGMQGTPQNTESKIALNLQVEALPACEVQLVLDAESGDVIKANGQGNLRLEYKNGAMKLYGEYALDQGTYNFTLQNIIRRKFKIKEGSSVRWTGDPFNPVIDISAYYTTNASLLDLLDESMLTDVKKLTVPVNCLLFISGDLSQPDIKFDIELPNSNEDLERQVRNVISSEDMMNREVLYLLSLGKFYKPEYMAVSTQTSTSDDLSSFIASTVSAQLNRWLSQINENLTMGVNYKSSATEDLSSTELGVELGATVLNNRLVLNGNIGYRNDISSTTNFVGDFDVEYKLNRSGRFRVKAYTHSNDKYYQKNATTQGAGFLYKEDFDTFGSLFRGYKERLFNRKERKEQKKAAKKQEKEAEAVERE